MSRTVLDASALLALVNGEPGGQTVAENLHESVISAVNLSEVVARMTDLGTSIDRVREHLESLHLEVIPFETEQAYIAGMLRAETRSVGLSLGDRACLALARRLRLPALTADRRWAELDVGIDVQVIR